MEITDYLRLLRKWWWLFLVAAVILGGAGYAYGNRQEPLYTADTTLMVGTYIESLNPTSGDINTGAQLARTYEVLVKTSPVLEGTIQALSEMPDYENIHLSTGQLRRMIDTDIIGGTSLLVLTVTSSDPAFSADAVNLLATKLIENSPTNLTPEQADQVDNIVDDIAGLRETLNELNARKDEYSTRLTELATQEGELTPAQQTEVTRLNDSLSLVIDQINAATANIAEYSRDLFLVQSQTNSLTIVEEANLPGPAPRRNPLILAIIGAAGGIILIGMFGLLMEYLDDTIKTPEDVLQTTALPVLGKIAHFGGRNPSYAEHLITMLDATSPVSEEYRALRTRLLYSTDTQTGSPVYIVTSPSASDGKTITAANLAVTLASANYNVLLIDADLRRPSMHEVFEVSNDVGLTTLLEVDPSMALDDNTDRLGFKDRFTDCMVNTVVPGLRLIPTGPIPANPAEMLGSVLMARWFEVFKQAGDVDVILFDTPPALSVADAYVLAATTEAAVMIVLRSRKTRRNAAAEVKDQFRQLGLDVRGIVLNNVKSGDMTYSHTTAYYPAGADTLQGRDIRPLLLEQVAASGNGSLPSHVSTRQASEIQTDQLRRTRAALKVQLKDIQHNAMVMFVEDNTDPMSVIVSRRITLGRYRDDMPDGEHVNLDEYDAFEKGVSRVHAAIYRRSDGFYMEDTGSSNGTWLNGDLLDPHEMYEIRNGSEVRLGALRLRLFYLMDGDEELAVLDQEQTADLGSRTPEAN